MTGKSREMDGSSKKDEPVEEIVEEPVVEAPAAEPVVEEVPAA